MGADIIIVDDDPLIGLVADQMLIGSGYQVRLLSDSLSAAEVIRRERPRLVLLDVCMPGLDGITLCGQLKADPQTQDIRIAALSGVAGEDSRRKMLGAGAEEFIPKPLDFETFPRTIARLMQDQPRE